MELWFIIWTALAAILVGDTLLIRSARLKRRDTRLTADTILLSFLVLCLLAVIIGVGGVVASLLPDEGDKVFWTWWQMTPQTFPEKP